MHSAIPARFDFDNIAMLCHLPEPMRYLVTISLCWPNWWRGKSSRLPPPDDGLGIHAVAML